MSSTTTSAAASAAAEASPRWRRFGGFFWLAYLPLYFIGWIWDRPDPLELTVTLGALAIFAYVVVDMFRRAGDARVWQVATIFALGLALSHYKAGWCVFTIYAMAFAGRLSSRRSAVIAIIVMELALLAQGALLRPLLSVWLSAVVFGPLSALGAMIQVDLERKNRALAAAQGEVRTLAVTAERERISRDLHDLLGHTLTLVAVKAELAARLVARDPAAAEAEMQSVAQAARDALSEVRTAVVGMRGASLSAEIEHAQRALAAANVAAEVSVAAPASDPQREAVLAMALREAVTNVIRHAGATRCRIRLETAPGGELRLLVQDDGRAGGPELREGSGLKGMRARLAAVGGDLEFTRDRKGARLVASVPAEAA